MPTPSAHRNAVFAISQQITLLSGGGLILLLLLGCNSRSSAPPEQARRPQPPAKEVLRFFAWNVESGGNDPARIESQLLNDFERYDAYALCEVHPDSIERYADALGDRFNFEATNSGQDDRMMILYDTEKFELVRHQEMYRNGDTVFNDGNHRSPLWIHLRLKSSGYEFVLMTNHLARRSETLRKQQAIGLREWARETAYPIFAIGDFNFDYDFPTQKGNESFVEFLEAGVWTWIAPEALVDTNWADPDGDGVDNYPHSMLDFAFVANGSADLDLQCRVIVRDGDFPDDENTSDHRPFELVVRLP